MDFPAREASLFLRSIAIAVTSGVLATVLGAWAGSRQETRTPGVALSLLTPLFVPTHVYAVVVRDLIGLSSTSGGGVGLAWLGVALILGLKHLGIGFLIVSWYGTSAEELVGITLRGRAWTRTHLTLPRIFPSLVLIFLIVFSIGLGDYTVASVMQVPTYTGEIFIAYAGLYDTTRTILLALPIAVLAGGAMAIGYGIQGRANLWTRDIAALPADGRRAVSYIGVGLLTVLSIGVPVARLLQMLAGWEALDAAVRRFGSEVAMSLGWATAAGSLALVLAFGAVEWIGWTGPRVRRSTEMLSLVCLGIPSIVTGFLLARTFTAPWFDALVSGPGVIVVGYLARIMPIALLVAFFFRRATPPGEEEAALVLGKSWWWRVMFLRITAWPTAVAGAWALLVALALDDVAVTIFVVPPSWQTTALRIYELTHYGAESQVAALCLLQLVIVGGLLLSVAAVRAGSRVRSEPRRKGAAWQ